MASEVLLVQGTSIKISVAAATELAALAPVADQRSEHDACGGRRLSVLLADQQEELADQPASRLFVVCAKDRRVELLYPRQAHLAHLRTARCIDDLEFLEDVPSSPRLFRKQWTLRYQRLSFDNPLFPIKARR